MLKSLRSIARLQRLMTQGIKIMKKVSMLVAGAALAFPMLASANPGCGLGSQVFEGQEGVFAHVLAATTNGTSGNQTFGMTSGTLGCDTSKPVVAAAVFLNDNMDQVAEDMSQGEGEALDALAELLGVSDKDAFAATTQQHFNQIFTSETATAEEVMANIESVI